MRKIVSIILAIAVALLGNVAFAKKSDIPVSNYSISMIKDDFFVVKEDNSLWVWGENRGGFLGTGTTENVKEPVKILDDVAVVKNNYAIKNDGSLWTWGMNRIFLHNQDTETSKPVKIMEDVSDIYSTIANIFILKKDASLWGAGYSFDGQLGYEEEYVDTPVKIMNNVKKVCGGRSNSIVLKTDGSVWTFGYSYREDVDMNKQPIKIMDGVKDIASGEFTCFAIKEDGTLWQWGKDLLGWSSSLNIFEPIYYTDNVKCISPQFGSALVVKNNGELWLYGESEEPESIFGLDMPLKIDENVNYISDGISWDKGNALVLKNNGDVYKYYVPTVNNEEQPYSLTKVFEGGRLIQTAYEPQTKGFRDIENQSDEVRAAVNSLSKAGIIDGVSDTEFAPNKTITRAEIAALLLRMTAKSEEDGNGGFSDVTEKQWYYDVAGASKKYGIVNGYDDNTFRGDEPITHLQLITLVSRTLKQEKGIYNSETTKMLVNVPNWARQDVMLAINEELIGAEDLLDIADDITRAEAAKILYRLYQKV